MHNPELDETGARFARGLAESSLVARVALAGYGAGWPDEYVATAVRSMNESGRLESVAKGTRRDDSRRRARVRALARRALVILYPCRDCGATAGAECLPDYGCENRDRAPDSSATAGYSVAVPDECSHGYRAPECPDCDVPSYWPSVLDTAPATDVD